MSYSFVIDRSNAIPTVGETGKFKQVLEHNLRNGLIGHVKITSKDGSQITCRIGKDLVTPRPYYDAVGYHPSIVYDFLDFVKYKSQDSKFLFAIQNSASGDGPQVHLQKIELWTDSRGIGDPTVIITRPLLDTTNIDMLQAGGYKRHCHWTNGRPEPNPAEMDL